MSREIAPDVSRNTAGKRPLSRSSLFVGFVILIGGLLGLAGLGSASLWDDEAQVAIIARNFLQQGRLTGWDGRNLLAYNNGTLLDSHLNSINPPLDYLIAAAGFRVFGISEWSARFPFVLLGILALVVYAALLGHIFRENRRIQVYAVTLMALSTPYLLTIRACRYYSPAILFALVALYGYYRSLSSRRAIHYATVAIGLVLLFYSQYLLCAAFLAAVAVAHVVVYRKTFAGSYTSLAVAMGAFLLASAPYAVHFRIWHRPDMSVAVASLSRLTFVSWNLEQIVVMGALSVPTLIIACWTLRPNNDGCERRTALAWILILLSYIVALDVLLPTHTMAVRYLAPIVPLAYGLSGIALGWIDRRSRPIAVAVTIVMVNCTTLSTWPPAFPGTWLLPGYLREIAHAYPTANAAVAEFLKSDAKTNDTVLVCPTYLNYPLMFYAGDKILVSDLIDNQSPLAGSAVVRGAPYLRKEEMYPDWFISFGKQPNDLGQKDGTAGWVRYLARPHLEAGQIVQYSYVLAATLPVYWDQTQRPELDAHSYGPVTGFDPNTEAVYICRRERYR